MSLLSAACTLARHIFSIAQTVTVSPVGAGETIELVARHLREHKVQKMIIANRTRERAQILADEVGAEVIALSEIDERLREADIIISPTASPLPIIGKGMVERALKSRRNRPERRRWILPFRQCRAGSWQTGECLLIVWTIPKHHLTTWRSVKPAVEGETIVAQETSEFMAWLLSTKRQRNHSRVSQPGRARSR